MSISTLTTSVVKLKDLVLDGYYYDKDTGARQEIPKNTFFKAGNKLYYFDSNGDFW